MTEAKHSALIRKIVIAIGLTFWLAALSTASFSQNNESILQERVTLTPQRTTVFDALNQLSDSTGYLFAYDSKAINGDKTVRLNIIDMPLKKAIEQIINNSDLLIKVANQHIIIYKNKADGDTLKLTPLAKKQKRTVKGRVVDSSTNKPLPFATVGIAKIGLGNVTNLDGIFILALPPDTTITHISISHIGYKSERIPVNILLDTIIDIPLEINYISIQEVVIRNIEPRHLVGEAVDRIRVNHSQHPLYLTSFYREGVLMNNKYQNYSEAIFQIYKTPYSKSFATDQVKLLKSRKTQNVDRGDTLSIKLRAGVNSSLALDIASNLPSFLDEETRKNYNFYKSDIVSIDSLTAYQVYFTQNESVTDPLFTGVIYIEMESLAILGADFEITPKYISKITGEYLHKGNRQFRIKPVQIKYSIRYKNYKGKYHISHVRGDLEFKYRKRRNFFYNPFNLFFELMISQSTDEQVERFGRKEIAATNNVFFDNSYEYDEAFWSDFNYISPEQSVFDALNQINAKIEEITQGK